MNPIEVDKMYDDRWDAQERALWEQYDEDEQQELANMVPL